MHRYSKNILTNLLNLFGSYFYLAGSITIFFSITLLVPIWIATIFKENIATQLFYILLACLIAGIVLCLLGWHRRREKLNIYQGFILSIIFWAIPGIIGSLPFLYSYSQISFVDALFESVSGLTTTGATILQGIEHMSPSIKFYRQQLQWIGGFGIAILAVLFLPLIKIGSSQFYKIMDSTNTNNSKITPNIIDGIKSLFIIYMFITIMCAISYFIAGMNLFDSITHSLSTVSIGGFSTYDNNLAHFNNRKIEIVAAIFIIISGINYALHFYFFKARNVKVYTKNAELYIFIKFIFIFSFLIGFLVVIYNINSDPVEGFITGILQSIFFASTSGFTITDISNWPNFLTISLLTSAFIGCCAGSMSGGIRILRVTIIIKNAILNIKNIIHPNALLSLKIGKKIIESPIILSILGYFTIYIATFLTMLIIISATSNLDFISTWSAVTATITNLGPGLNEVGLNYAKLNDITKILLAFTMIIGRLDIIPIIVILFPTFWKRIRTNNNNNTIRSV